MVWCYNAAQSGNLYYENLIFQRIGREIQTHTKSTLVFEYSREKRVFSKELLNNELENKFFDAKIIEKTIELYGSGFVNEKTFEQILDSKDRFFLIFKKNFEVKKLDFIGIASLNLNSFHIGSLLLLPEYRKQGLGSQIITCFFKIYGFSTLKAVVKEKNQSGLNFFRKNALFDIFEKKTHYFTILNKPEGI